jgi:hypothetical protein
MKSYEWKELEEIFQLLEAEGMNPQWCDTPVKFFDNGVKAGIPTEMGMETPGEVMMLARDMAGIDPVFMITVVGDSMKDAGIDHGDKLHVRTDVTIADGDIVLAWLNGKSTVKTYFSEGDRKWLLPENDAYDPILLDESMQVRIIGRVEEVIKHSHRISYSACVQKVKNAFVEKPRTVTREMAEEVIGEIAGQIGIARQWYAVYRPLVDAKVLPEGSYEDFTEWVKRIVPSHPHLPKAVEMQRMYDKSFRNAVVLWDKRNAPVQGKRFDEYRRIAEEVRKRLS